MPKITAHDLKKQKEILEDLKTTEKISKIVVKLLETSDIKRDEHFYRYAEDIFNKHYVKLKHTRLKRALSSSEIKKIFDDKSVLKKTITVYKGIHKTLGDAVKCASRATKTFELFYALKAATSINPEDENQDKLTRDRNQLLKDYQKMRVLTTALKSIASKAPFLIGDYMNLVLDVFNNAEGAIMIFKNYAEKLTNSEDYKKMDGNLRTILNRKYDVNREIFRNN